MRKMGMAAVAPVRSHVRMALDHVQKVMSASTTPSEQTVVDLGAGKRVAPQAPVHLRDATGHLTVVSPG
jgi:hypothetical protein